MFKNGLKVVIVLGLTISIVMGAIDSRSLYAEYNIDDYSLGMDTDENSEGVIDDFKDIEDEGDFQNNDIDENTYSENIEIDEDDSVEETDVDIDEEEEIDESVPISESDSNELGHVEDTENIANDLEDNEHNGEDNETTAVDYSDSVVTDIAKLDQEVINTEYKS